MYDSFKSWWKKNWSPDSDYFNRNCWKMNSFFKSLIFTLNRVRIWIPEWHITSNPYPKKILAFKSCKRVRNLSYRSHWKSIFYVFLSNTLLPGFTTLIAVLVYSWPLAFGHQKKRNPWPVKLGRMDSRSARHTARWEKRSSLVGLITADVSAWASSIGWSQAASRRISKSRIILEDLFSLMRSFGLTATKSLVI